MQRLLNLGEMLAVHASKHPDRVCLLDRSRSYTFQEVNARVCRLAGGLLALGLKKGDTVSALLENCIEFVELYLAAAKTGLLLNPLHFRHTAEDLARIVEHAGSQALVVSSEFCSLVDTLRDRLAIVSKRYVVVDGSREGYLGYEALLAGSEPVEPEVSVSPSDPWILLYTSGTTGRPKGVIRSHESHVLFYLLNAVDFGFRPDDRVLSVMPLCHVNPLFFTFTLLYIGGSAYIHPARGFDAQEILSIIDRARINFISLIPTHYAQILTIQAEQRERFDVSTLRKLLCSSAPARLEQKRAILKAFPWVELYEGYGSTEAGSVTLLYPDEQLEKLGSIGRESLGTDRLCILDEAKKPVPRGQVGELHCRGPTLFTGYHRDPDRTAEAFNGEYYATGDLAYQDPDGYYYLVERKNNLIITGGEHVFPSEVEAVLCSHEAVQDAAVIAVPDPRWGEAVKALVVLKQSTTCQESELLDFCRTQMASFKRPKSICFVSIEEIPRTVSGKVKYQLLREKWAKS